MLQSFNDCRMSVGIEVEYPVPHIHAQNCLGKVFIKRLQVIARTLVMRTKLSITTWGSEILHIVMLVRLRPTTTQSFLPLIFLLGTSLTSHTYACLGA